MTNLSIIDLGFIAYAEAWELQKRVVAARKAGAIEDVLLFCEHPHVITLGRSGNRANLLASENVLRQKGVEYFETSRGGDITYHGPGQIVGYPILNLGAIRRDVVWYVRTLEEAMIRATAELGISARRETGKTGIWVGQSGAEEKLAAIGAHISRWVTSHGFAYNVATDLRYFDLIEASGKPKDALFKLINSEGAERQRLFREIVTRSYRFVFANSLDLEKATRRQIEEVFADQNVGGETRRKALGFFLALSLDAGLKVSPHIKVRNGKLQIGRRRPPIREPKQQPAKSDWLELLLAKFPSFDPDWSDEIKTRWFDSFEKLMERNGSLR